MPASLNDGKQKIMVDLKETLDLRIVKKVVLEQTD